MSNSAEFAPACPEPHFILGLRLLPLSLGRYRLLKRFNSPFVSDKEESIDLKTLTSELLLALVICGLSFSEFNKHIENGTLEKELVEWGLLLSDQIKNEKHFSILEKAEAFKHYLAEGSKIPWEILNKNNEQASPTHWSQAVEVTLMSKVGWTMEQVDEEPLTRAWIYFFKYLESEGVVRLIDPDQYIVMQAEATANGDALKNFLGVK